MSEIQAEETAIEIPDDNEVEQAEVESTLPEGVEDEVVVSIGDPPPSEESEPTQAQAPWVTELRKNYRELQKKNRELEEKVKSSTTTQEERVDAGKKPTLEDFDWDSEKYEAELSNWFERKKKAEEQNVKIRLQKEAEEKAWQDKLIAYGDAKTKLKVSDYEDAELVAQDVLSKTQQGIIIDGAENPALLVYALGKNPSKAKELAAITNPVKYAFAVAKLETQLKVTSRKAPPPEATVGKGSAAISGSVDSTLDRLRAEAAKTGDMSKVLKYKLSKRSG